VPVVLVLLLVEREARWREAWAWAALMSGASWVKGPLGTCKLPGTEPQVCVCLCVCVCLRVCVCVCVCVSMCAGAGVGVGLGV